MGNATVQGKLWGAHARDFAERLEQVVLPLHGAALDAARVESGTALLDAGCGAGLLALLATLRGAQVSALDASEALVKIARERLPAADARVGDLEELPFEDSSFDAVTAVNSIFFTADMSRAMRELARVVRPGGRVVVTAWGPPEKSEFLAAVMPAIGPLMPPPPPGAAKSHPAALSQPGALATLVSQAGLVVVEEGEVSCPFVFPSIDASWRANSSAGPNELAVAHSGEDAVRSALAQVDRAHVRPDGGVRYENIFLWVAAQRPQ